MDRRAGACFREVQQSLLVDPSSRLRRKLRQRSWPPEVNVAGEDPEARVSDDVQHLLAIRLADGVVAGAEEDEVIRAQPGWVEEDWPAEAFPYALTDFERQWMDDGKSIQVIRVRKNRKAPHRAG